MGGGHGLGLEREQNLCRQEAEGNDLHQRQRVPDVETD